MVIARVIIGLLALAAVLCFASYAVTGQARWRQRGWRIVKWTLVSGLAFFAVLVAERVAQMI